MDDDDGFNKDDFDDIKSKLSESFPKTRSLPSLITKRDLGFHKSNVFKHLEEYGEDSFIISDKNPLQCKLPGAPKSTFLMVFSPDGYVKIDFIQSSNDK